MKRDGEIIVDFEGKIRDGIPFLPRFGLRAVLTKGQERVTYFGYGPHECYCDKNSSVYKSKFYTDVDSLFENYLMPQENGSHFGTDWVRVTNREQGCCSGAKLHFLLTPLIIRRKLWRRPGIRMSCKQERKRSCISTIR